MWKGELSVRDAMPVEWMNESLMSERYRYHGQDGWLAGWVGGWVDGTVPAWAKRTTSLPWVLHWSSSAMMRTTTPR